MKLKKTLAWCHNGPMAILFVMVIIAVLVPSQVLGKTPKYGGTMRVGLSYDPITLSSMMSGGDPGLANFSSSIYDSLLTPDYSDSSLHPGLATEWKQIDDLTWEIKLRKGVQFHKGYGELTAEDVAFTINYIIKENKRSKYLLRVIKTAEVIDRYTVRFHLTQASAPFLITSLGYVGGMPVSKKAFFDIGPDKFLRNPVGTGPFEFVRWVSGSEVVLKRNEKYWRKGLPYLDRLVHKIIPDDFVRQNMLINGDLDLIEAPDRKNIAQLEKNPNIVVYRSPGQNWDYIAFNLTDYKTANPILKNKKVRQAISYAIDREEIVKAIYYGYATLTDQPIAPSILGSRPGPLVYPYKANLEKARQLLKEAGYEKGFEATCMTSGKVWLRKELELVAAQLAKVGIRIKIEPLDMATFNARRKAKERPFEMMLEDINNVSPDPDSTLYWFHHTGTTAYHGPTTPADPELEALLDKGKAISDVKKRVPIYHKIVDKVLDDCSYIYICHVDWITGAAKYVKGYNRLPVVRQFFNEVWLDK